MKRMIALLALGLIIVVGSIGSASATTGLILHLDFEGNVLDASGNALHGVITGDPTFVASTDRAIGGFDFGQAISLDGIGDFVTVADNDLLDVTSITLMAWVNVTSFGPGDWAAMIDKTGPQCPIGLIPGPGGFKFEERHGFGEAYFIVETNPWAPLDWNAPAGTTTNIETGTWHHIAGTFDETTGVLDFFVDGGWEAGRIAPDGAAAPIPGSIVDLIIGHYTGTTVALIDELRIYNRALTLGEIQEVAVIPEPATMILLGLGLSFMGLKGLKKKKA